MNKCKYCGQEYDSNYRGGYCSQKCKDDEARARRETEAHNAAKCEEQRQRREERDEEKRQARAIKEAKEEEIKNTTSQSANRSIKLAFLCLFTVLPLINALGTKAWWVLVLPLYVIYLGHKGLKEIKQSNGVRKGKLAAFIGLFFGYLTALAGVAGLFSD